MKKLLFILINFTIACTTQARNPIKISDGGIRREVITQEYCPTYSAACRQRKTKQETFYPPYFDQFDFGDDAYFKTIFQTGEQVSSMKEFRNSRTARGPRHALYINRTYFGLYNILNELKAVVQTRR